LCITVRLRGILIPGGLLFVKIGIIGSGMIGGTLAGLWNKAGHEVAISNSRGPESLAETAKQAGPGVRAATVEEAARFGDLVLAAVPLKAYRSLPASALAGKIVVDAMNYYPDRDGHIAELDSGAATSSELLARHLPQSRIVKAFNTIYFKHLAANGDTARPISERRAIFIAGDDQAAKETVARLIEEIGFGAVDTGGLREGGTRQQPGTAIYNREISVGAAHEVLGRH
jgi:8-hydroxy-5-deazaflavin:NADPH oxidoreductase